MDYSALYLYVFKSVQSFEIPGTLFVHEAFYGRGSP